jgi:tRNA G10  N-methylase Trm11
VKSRMVAKITRTFKRFPTVAFCKPRVSLVNARKFPFVRGVQAVITSPPYMNELDYIRDNRLRLWFIDRALPVGLELRTLNKQAAFTALMSDVCSRIAEFIKPNGVFALVLGDTTRGGRSINTATIAKRIFSTHERLVGFRLVAEYRDKIPDIRRSRRECKGTKTETVLVYRQQ